MFIGSIPKPLRSLIHEHVKQWSVPEIYVGCSGNFTIERVVSEFGLPIHGNDVQAYTTAIAKWAMGETMPIRVTEGYREAWGWLDEYLDTPERIWSAYRSQWDSLLDKTIQKIERQRFKLASYYCGDVLEFVRSANPEAGFCSFPPFYTGGYETLYEGIDKVFEWDTPVYKLFDDDSMKEFVSQVTSKKEWLFGSNIEWPELDERFVGKMQTTNRNVPFYVYASTGTKRVVMPKQELAPVLNPRLEKGDVLTGKMSLSILKPAQFAALRSQYLNANIRPGSPGSSVAVLCDGKIIGCFALKDQGAVHDLMDSSYLFSDFAVRPTDYPRLSKLVLMAALSHEGRMLVERLRKRRMRWLFTTAFSKNPVSMKYRGIFDLISRKPCEEPGFEWQLNYRGELGQWSLQEGFEIWQRKYARES